MQRHIFARERVLAGAPPLSPMGIAMAGPAILHFGTPEQKEMAQDALNRFWGPALMMFGPPDTGEAATEGGHTEQSMAWGIKRFSNDDLRQKFIDMTVPQDQKLGLTLPDPDLRWNAERGHWDFGPIDWDEFFRVIKGHGQMNRARLEARNQAHDEGAWVREALNAYEAKQHGQAAD